jgi:hypothetical protein
VTFDQLSKDRKADLVDFLVRRHGWPRERAVEELRALDDTALAYVGVEMRLARRSENQYDPGAENYTLR